MDILHKMKRRTVRISLLAMLIGATVPVHADVWDLAGDATVGTTANVLWHTAPAQRHDLANSGGTPDQDWYKIFPRANRSYEVQVMNATVNMATGFGVSRTSTGGVVQESSVGLDPAGNSRALRWITGASDLEERVQVIGTAGSTVNAQYDIQLRETTLFCPRYNNAGTQVSVLIVQRASTETGAGACQVNAFFYDESATLTASFPQTLTLNDMSAISAPTIPGLPGTKGALHIAHTCGVGGLKGKLVALEPATGFSFDTPCTERDR